MILTCDFKVILKWLSTDFKVILKSQILDPDAKHTFFNHVLSDFVTTPNCMFLQQNKTYSFELWEGHSKNRYVKQNTWNKTEWNPD